MQFIVTQVRNIMRNGIKRFAKKEGIEPKYVQIGIHFDKETELPKFKKYIEIEGEKTKESDITFEEILDEKLDLLEREKMAQPYLQAAFLMFADELNCDIEELHIMIRVKDNEKAEPLLNLIRHYKANGEYKSEKVKKVSLEEDIFTDANEIEKPRQSEEKEEKTEEDPIAQ